ncbi:phage tail assembly protein [Pseudomonas fulva]|uniref:phage tail assembly protein n=1 Tax=Pseudomonas fulva TaxID=47880 RepID=UPI00345D96F8
MTKPLPKYLTLTDAGITVRLSRSTDMNGVQIDSIHLRAPTVRDVRSASTTAAGDEEQAELNLFASLAEVGAKDLEGLALKDYTRLQAGYFRLVQDDEV